MAPMPISYLYFCPQNDPRKPRARPLLVKQPAVPEDVVAYIAGDAIADLCRGVPTYFVVEQDPPMEDDDDSHEVPPPPSGTRELNSLIRAGMQKSSQKILAWVGLSL